MSPNKSNQILIFSDQTASSLTNFLVIIGGARLLQPSDFGRFSILLSLYFVALGLAQAIGGEIFLIYRLPLNKPSDVRAGLHLIILCAVPAGVIIACITLTFGLCFAAGVVLALALPGLLLQDALRYVAFAAGRPSHALAADVLWLILLIIGFEFHPAIVSIFYLTVLWTLSGIASALLIFVASPLKPERRTAHAYYQRYRNTGRYLLGEAALVLGSAQALLYVTAAIVGLSDVAGLRVVMTLFGPLNVAFGALRVGTIRQLQASRIDEARKKAAWASSFLVILTICYTILLTNLPNQLGSDLFGSTWRNARPLVIYYGFFYGLFAATFGPYCFLRALIAAQQTLIARAITTLLIVIGAIVGSIADGTKGGVIACSFAAFVDLCIMINFARLACDSLDTLSLEDGISGTAQEI